MKRVANCDSNPPVNVMQYGQPVNGESGKDLNWGMDGIPDLDKEFTIDMIVKDNFVDVCVGNRRTLINGGSANGDRLFFFARNGEVEFEDIEVRPLACQPPAASPMTLSMPAKWTIGGNRIQNAAPHPVNYVTLVPE